eukprot:1290666-Pyramimonas_sp.AAC.1
MHTTHRTRNHPDSATEVTPSTPWFSEVRFSEVTPTHPVHAGGGRQQLSAKRAAGAMRAELAELEERKLRRQMRLKELRTGQPTDRLFPEVRI